MMTMTCVRSISLELEPSTYVDIGDRVTAAVDYGAGRSIDTEQFKTKTEVSKVIAWDQTLDVLRTGSVAR